MDTAARTNPFGCPGPVTLRVVILTVLSPESERAVQDCPPEVLIFVQNVLIILWASLIRFLLASDEGITAKVHKHTSSLWKTIAMYKLTTNFLINSTIF